MPTTPPSSIPGDLSAPAPSPTGQPPRLMEQVHQAGRLRHFSPRTDEAYCLWIRRFILFHDKRHPRTLAAPEVTRFLTSLATDQNVSAATQNQALSALLFLYRQVLDLPFDDLTDLVRVRTPPRLPVVLDRQEVRRVLAHLTGVPALVASILYGAGLRILECLELRIKDIDLQRDQPRRLGRPEPLR